MKVQSPLATLDIGIGAARRNGNDLVLTSRAGGSMETMITVSAAEVLRTVGTILASPSALIFVLGLPFFWLRQRLGRGSASTTGEAGVRRTVDINKPW